VAEEEFEVRGAHEHALDHMAEHKAPLGQAIALFSAVLATLGAIVSLFGGHTQNEALYLKNEAVLLKAQASDQWAYYQSEDLKRHMAELGVALAPDKNPGLTADIAKYKGRAQALRQKAEDLDRRSTIADEESRKALAPHTKLAISMTALQIAIALASITALTGRRWLFWGAGIAALAGVLLGAAAWW
jgi:hypothetical protein